MWLIFLLIWNFILFSLFSISSCALPIDNNNNKNNNNNNNKDVNLNSNLNKNKDSVISSKRNAGPEGNGPVPANEIISDDEDIFKDIPDVTRTVSRDRPGPMHYSGDGPLYDNNNNEPPVITNPGSHHDSTINKNPDIEDDDDTEDDTEDDEEDDEGSGDLDSPSKEVFNGGSDSFPHTPKETIFDDDNDNDRMPTGNKPDTTDIHTDSSEDNKDINIDSSDKSSDNFSPGFVETSTKQSKPNRHDIDHDEDDDHDDLDDSHDQDEDDDHDQNENTLRNDISILGRKQDTRPVSFFAQPSMLAAVIGGIVVSLLCAILLAMFIIYRTRKKDEGSYICEPSLTSPVISHYGKASSNKFYDP